MEKFILYGTGWEALQFFYRFAEKDKIKYVLNSDKKGYFCGYKIVSFNEIDIDSSTDTIIVAAEYEAYFEIYKFIRRQNSTVKIIWSKLIKGVDDRKCVLINANCLRGPITQFLNNCPSFIRQYRLIDFPATQLIDTDIVHDYWEVLQYIVSEIDLYIHQDIKSDNEISYYLSDQFLLQFLKKDARHICIPNFVGFGLPYFPDITLKESRNFEVLNGKKIIVFANDALIDGAFEKYNSLDEIVSYMMNENNIDFDSVREAWEHKMNKMKLRDQNWDIKIYDFVEKNYKKHKLFNDYDHPSKYLLEYVCRKLGNLLNLEEADNIPFVYDLDWREQFIWPGVKKALALEFTEENVRLGQGKYFDKLACPELTVKEYIRQYIFWKYEVYLNE